MEGDRDVNSSFDFLIFHFLFAQKVNSACKTGKHVCIEEQEFRAASEAFQIFQNKLRLNYSLKFFYNNIHSY